MGHSLSKEEQAVVKLLQHILSKRGLQYDSAALQGLLKWSRGRGFIPTVQAAFEISEWERIGQALWDEISKGTKETQKHSTLWRMKLDTLKEMKSERAVVASVLVVTAPPQAQSGTGAGATSMAFAPPTVPATVPRKPSQLAGKKKLRQRSQSAGRVERATPGVPDPEEGDPESAWDPGPGSPESEPDLYPPESDSDSDQSVCPAHQQRIAGLAEEQLQLILKRLEASETGGVSGPSAPPSYNSFLKEGVLGEESGKGSGGGKNPAHSWGGFIRDAIVDREFADMGPSAYPVFTTKQGVKEWEALDLKIVKEARQAVTTYGYSGHNCSYIFGLYFSTV
ncbi:uncharacterized protein LOC136004412 [Lathamus discolor]|uniref:uncharacterized protein LOC136004412 n=1 Tax=Lathamus discolor TaxID=678569 RepID=UPI0032B73258